MRRLGIVALRTAIGALLALGVLELAFFSLVKARLFQPNVDGWYALDGNVRFHPVSGYVHTGDARFVRIGAGRIDADRMYRLAHGDYFSRAQAGLVIPPRPKGTRIVVLGDSFTDSTLYLQRSWVDRTERLLQASGRDTVVLPYAFAGNGLAAWNSVYRHWLTRNESFDVLVFAGIYDDYSRTLMVAQGTRNYIHMQRVGTSAMAVSADGGPPSTIYRCGGVEVVSRPMLDWLVRTGRGEIGVGFNAVRYLGLHARRVFFHVYSEPGCAGRPLTERERERLLDEILVDLAARGTPVVFAIVPERDPLIAYLRNQSPPPGVGSIADIAARARARVFDGYEAFRRVYERRADRSLTPEAFVRAMWLSYDAHWGQSGSDLFGELFASFLVDQPRR